MRHILLLSALLLAIGCAENKTQKQTPVDANALIVAEIKRQMAELESSSASEIAALKGTLDKVSKESKATANDLQQQILLKDQRIAGLETRIQELQREIRELKKSMERKEPDAAASQPPPTTDPFPIRVFGVAGLKMVTGQHTTVRQVETGKTSKDLFGDQIPQTRPESVEVNEYGYQASFSVENPTAEAVEISVSAGSKTATFVVPAGQVLSNLTVDSAMGADLAVRIGDHMKRFPVVY